MMTRDDLHYAVNVSIGANYADSQKFSLSVDLQYLIMTVADVSFAHRNGRGFTLRNASNVRVNGTGYYVMKDYIQVRLFLGITATLGSNL